MAFTVIELQDEMPDEARLALLDLDIGAPAFRGRLPTWNAEK
jgi:hypothetical protein